MRTLQTVEAKPIGEARVISAFKTTSTERRMDGDRGSDNACCQCVVWHVERPVGVLSGGELEDALVSVGVQEAVL